MYEATPDAKAYEEHEDALEVEWSHETFHDDAEDAIPDVDFSSQYSYFTSQFL